MTDSTGVIIQKGFVWTETADFVTKFNGKKTITTRNDMGTLTVTQET